MKTKLINFLQNRELMAATAVVRLHNAFCDANSYHDDRIYFGLPEIVDLYPDTWEGKLNLANALVDGTSAGGRYDYFAWFDRLEHIHTANTLDNAPIDWEQLAVWILETCPEIINTNAAGNILWLADYENA